MVTDAILQTLTEAEQQLPEIPKMAEKMKLTLNEPAQFIYTPRTRKNIITRAFIPIAATSAIIIANIHTQMALLLHHRLESNNVNINFLF
ncbi:MAG: hypothetical protein ACTSYM_03255 [Candidatus Baldrarchaeia archaeon]